MATRGIAHGEAFRAGRHQIVPTPSTGNVYTVDSVAINNRDAIAHNVKLAVEHLSSGQIEIVTEATLAPGEGWLLVDSVPLAANEENAVVLVLDSLCGTRPVEWSLGYTQETAASTLTYTGAYLGEYSNQPDTSPGGGSNTTGLESTLALASLLAAWVADDLVDSVADGGSVASWASHDGSLVADGGAGVLTHADSAFNSQPAVGFSAPFVTLGNTNWQTMDTLTYVAVLYTPGGHGSQAVFGSGGNTGSTARSGLYFDTSGKMRFVHQSNRQAEGSTPPTTVQCLHFWHDKSNYPYMNAERDGAVLSLGSMYNDGGTVQDDKFVLGSMHEDGTFGVFSGRIALILVFNGLLSGADLSTVEGEIGAKYGITFA